MFEDVVFLVSVLVAWAALYVVSRLTDLKRFGVRVEPLFLMKDSPRLRGLLDALSTKNKGMWVVLLHASVVISAGLMAYSLYFLINNIPRFFIRRGYPAAVVPLLPGITVRVYWLPYIIISALVAVLSHELAHGVAARIHRIPIKSAGVFVVFVLPGGFVEPDEEKFEESPLLKRLHVLSAGPSANLVVGALAMLLLTACFASPSGVFITEVARGGPAAAAGLGRWDIIYSVNGTRVRDAYSFYQCVGSASPGEKLLLETSRGEVVVTVCNRSGRAYIGVSRYYTYYPTRFGLWPQASIHLYLSLYWIFILSLSAAIFNMLPLYPFDGERFLYYVVGALVKRGGRWVRIALNAACLSIFALNVALSILRFGITLL